MRVVLSPFPLISKLLLAASLLLIASTLLDADFVDFLNYLFS